MCENLIADILASENTIKNKKSAGRPREERTVCKKCGLNKQLVHNRLVCRDCWNANSKSYYKSNEEYAERKRAKQRAKLCLFKTVDMESIVANHIGSVIGSFHDL